METSTKELVSGPATLGEYLDIRSQIAKAKTDSYQADLDSGKAFMVEATQKIIDKEKDEYARIDEAEKQLARGDKEPALEILREDQERLKRWIEHNRKHKNWKNFKEQNAELVVLQMLEADAIGSEPAFYGTKLPNDEEPYVPPETVKRSDLVIASLFKTVYSIERDREMRSGMMYRPSSERLIESFDQLFDYDNALTENEKEILKKCITSIFGAIEDFGDKDLRVNYDTSYPGSPFKKMKPQEIMRLSKPHRGSSTPNTLVYIEGGGELKSRFSADQQKVNQVFDLSKSAEGITQKSIARVDLLPKELEDKVLKVLTSKELKEHWSKLNPTQELRIYL